MKAFLCRVIWEMIYFYGIESGYLEEDGVQ